MKWLAGFIGIAAVTVVICCYQFGRLDAEEAGRRSCERMEAYSLILCKKDSRCHHDVMKTGGCPIQEMQNKYKPLVLGEEQQDFLTTLNQAYRKGWRYEADSRR